MKHTFTRLFTNTRRDYLAAAIAVIFILAAMLILTMNKADFGVNSTGTYTPPPQASPTKSAAAPTANNTVPTSSQQQTPGETMQSPTQAPTQQPANITHPTAANCLPNNETFTVYASQVNGTPVIRDNPPVQEGVEEVLYTAAYSEEITAVYCNPEKTKLFRNIGRGIYGSVKFEDVSLYPL